MTNSEEQLFDKNLDKLKKQTTEIIEWNYTGIESVDFAWDDSPDNGLIKSKKIPELGMSPMGSFGLMGYVNSDIDKKVYAKLNVDYDKNIISIERVSSSGFENLDKNPDYRNTRTDDRHEFHLDYSDIQELKKQGYTSDITFEQIKQYFDNKNVEKETE